MPTPAVDLILETLATVCRDMLLKRKAGLL
jgi:hypothetical protein